LTAGALKSLIIVRMYLKSPLDNAGQRPKGGPWPKRGLWPFLSFMSSEYVHIFRMESD
jgi:hypothetical protein